MLTYSTRAALGHSEKEPMMFKEMVRQRGGKRRGRKGRR